VCTTGPFWAEKISKKKARTSPFGDIGSYLHTNHSSWMPRAETRILLSSSRSSDGASRRVHVPASCTRLRVLLVACPGPTAGPRQPGWEPPTTTARGTFHTTRSFRVNFEVTVGCRRAARDCQCLGYPIGLSARAQSTLGAHWKRRACGHLVKWLLVRRTRWRLL
jgi:hypothetical protein